MNFKKLSEAEARDLYLKLRGYFGDSDYIDLIVLVREYFPGAKKVLINLESEYDDQHYSHRLGGVFVFGEGDVEIPLTFSARENFTRDLSRVAITLPDQEDQPMEDIVLRIGTTLPDIYMEAK